MSCELEFKHVYQDIKAFAKRHDSFLGADLVCRITHPEDYPNNCPERNKLQLEYLDLENRLFDSFMKLSQCVNKLCKRE